MFLGRWGVAVSREDLLTRRMDQFCGIFVFLEGREGGGGANLPCGIRIFGSSVWRGSSGCGVLLPADAGPSIGAGSLPVSGDSVEIALIDRGSPGDEAQFVTELQIPFFPVRGFPWKFFCLPLDSLAT